MVVDFGLEPAKLPDGREIDMEVVRHPGGAVIACVNDDEQICLIRQFRHAAGGWIWELPAGLLEPGEPAIKTAERELIEETGVRGCDWQSLGVILSTPGFSDEKLHLFSARVQSLGESALEENEFIEVHWVSLSDAVLKAQNGEYQDAKTVIGILRVAAAQ